jgi:putative protease
MKTFPPKILAPAGGRKQFFAALNAGADGVYLGLKSLSARAGAENFSCEDLEELMPVAQKYGMEVLVAINTILEQRDLFTQPEVLSRLLNIEVSGIIVQDLGEARLIRKHFPELPLHASTQMAIHNVEGLNALAELGFKRVVLARELSIPEIKTLVLVSKELNLETEVFCHGSLCYSYSGVCLFGGIMDGRSGNRGTCPYPCRRSYVTPSSPSPQHHPLSMRDLDSLDLLKELSDTGVSALKIEGRKKDEQYVVSTIQSYRAQLNEHYGFDTLRLNAPKTPLPTEKELAENRSLSFQRRPTTLFLGDPSPTLDPFGTTHAGKEVGLVERTVGSSIRTSLDSDLELHDGLAVETLPGELTAFGVSRLFVQGRSVTSAKAKTPLEILLPQERFPTENDFPKPGAKIFKVRSAALRARAESLIHPPAGERLRPLWPCVCELSLQWIPGEESATLHLVVKKYSETILSHTAQVQAQIPRSSPDESLNKLKQELKNQFEIWGDAKVRAEIKFSLPAEPVAIAPSQLKAIKRALTPQISQAFQSWIEQRQVKATKALQKEGASSDPVGKTDSFRLIARTDNPALLTTLSSHSIAEAIDFTFALHRAHLQALSPSSEECLESFFRDFNPSTRIALPLILRGEESEIASSVVNFLIKKGFRNFEAGNLGAVHMLHNAAKIHAVALNLAADYFLYARNSEAVNALEEWKITSYCLSPEDTKGNLESRFFQNLGTPVALLYADIPLMHSESCAIKASSGRCEKKTCSNSKFSIQDERGRSFVVYSDACRNIVTAEKPWSRILDAAVFWNLGIRNFRVDFILRNYSSTDALDILTETQLKLKALTT